MTSLTADLGLFTANLTLAKIPEAGRATARMGIADCVGVMIAGSHEPGVGLVDRELGHTGGKVQASLVPSGEKRDVEDAALINGVAAHVLDYDDVALDGHPSAVLVPAILAQAEASRASGADLLTAYVAGYEVWGEIVAHEPGHLHQKGWHPTAVCGTVAAAAACAKLRGLSAGQTATALAIAASMASGLVANFGSMTKPFQVGRAAQSGLIAAKLAEAGLTASPDALEHPSGFLAAFSPSGKPDRERGMNLSRNDWHILREGLNVKRYPTCYATHRSIDGVLDLIEQHDLASDDIGQIRIRTGETQLAMLRNHRPQTGLEAKFSMEFAMASSIIARKVGLSQLVDSFVTQPEVQALYPRVSFETTTDMMSGLPFAPFDTVEISTREGQVLRSGKIEHAKGSHALPLSEQDLWAKFSDCLGDGVPETTKARAFETWMTLDQRQTEIEGRLFDLESTQ